MLGTGDSKCLDEIHLDMIPSSLGYFLSPYCVPSSMSQAGGPGGDWAERSVQFGVGHTGHSRELWLRRDGAKGLRDMGSGPSFVGGMQPVGIRVPQF